MPKSRYARRFPPPRFVNMRAYQEAIRLFVNSAWQGPELTGLVHIGIDFYRGIPKSCPKTAEKKQRWLQEHIGARPDWDNYYKAAADALQGLILGDDSRNLGPGPLGGSKFYAEDGNGYTVIRVQEAG